MKRVLRDHADVFKQRESWIVEQVVCGGRGEGLGTSGATSVDSHTGKLDRGGGRRT